MNITVVRQAPPNPRAAIENRQAFDALGLTCVNLLGAAGSGKTALLEAILPRLRDELRVGVVAGDLASIGDAQRIAALNVPVVQVLTDGGCHLTGAQLQAGIQELPLGGLDLIIVENVGSTICAATRDLGEHLRAAVLSVAAGAEGASKYDELYRRANLILLTKLDLLPHVEFDLDATLDRLRSANPNAEIVCTDARRRVGIDRLAGWLLGYVRAQRARHPWAARAAGSVELATH
jgi:hydrogenase nickel incorporation protein HypB